MEIFFFIFGLFWGSFLNNVAYRLKTGENFFFTRSHCPICKKTLSVRELIPIVSFLIQKGRCLGCQNKISLRYPLTEILTAIFTFTLALIFKPWLNFFFLIEFLFYFLLLSVIFILALYDFDTFLVDDRFLFFLFLLGLAFIFYHSYLKIPYPDFSYLLNYIFILPPYLETLFSSIFLALLFLFIYFITKGEGLGFGDVKTVFVIGFFLKLGDALIFLIFSSLLGSLYGLILFLKEKNLKKPIPFIPFFFLGLYFTLVLGKTISTKYLNLISF